LRDSFMKNLVERINLNHESSTFNFHPEYFNPKELQINLLKLNRNKNTDN
jgi:hypothetical protein